MNLREQKLYINTQLKFLVISLLIMIGFSFIVLQNLKLIFANNIMNNIFYTQVINYALPVVKTISFDEDIMSESQFSLQDALLKSIGVNVDSPASLISKELPFFKVLALNTSSDAVKQTAFSFTPFSLEDSMILKVKIDETADSNNSTEIQNKNVTVYDPSLKNNSNSSKPQVLIYHSHTTESFKPYGNFNATEANNITEVGSELKKELEKNYGISVIHDKTSHVKGSYIQAYARSRETVDKQLKQYGDFKLIIDMHRDAASTKKSVTTKLNGENVAKLMFVLAKKNPHFDKNKAVTDKLTNISNDLFPGLFRPYYYFNYGSKYFNQDKSNNAFLIEVGSNINELEEAKESTKYLARIIAEYINGKR